MRVLARSYVGLTVQSTHKISGDAGAGFAAYLTADNGRGDYYAGGDAEGGGGVWHGSPKALGELGLDRAAAAECERLTALMNGLSPATGEPIRRVGGDGSRVAGIDLTFSAPKSVSALWAVSGPYRRAQIEAAHRKAVASTLERIECDVELVRPREDGVLRWERAESLVAAEFVHTSSRLTRDQGAMGWRIRSCIRICWCWRRAARTGGSQLSIPGSCFARTA